MAAAASIAGSGQNAFAVAGSAAAAAAADTGISAVTGVAFNG